MLPYYLMVAWPTALTLLLGKRSDEIKERNKNKIIMWNFFAFLLVLLMLRHESVGVDIVIYLLRFEENQGLSFKEIFTRYESEYGYYILNKIISFFTTNEKIFVGIMAVLCTLPVAKLYAKETEMPLLTISIFLIGSNFDMLFSGFRQALAFGIIASSYKFIKEKKLIPFLLMIILAILFHKSAIVAIIIYPFYHMNITRPKMLVMIPIVGVIFAFKNQIFEYMADFFEEYSERYELEETGAYLMIVLFALFLLFAYLAPDDDKLDKETVGLRNIMLLAFIFQIFALTNSVAMRMNYYNTLFVPLLVPKIINRSSEENKHIYQWVGGIMAAFFIFYYFYRAHTGEDILQLYPYKSIWDKA